MQELLTPSQMAVADRTAIESGTPGIDLMEAAGQVLFETVEKHFSKALRILVVCGPGNNGGDGYVVAGLLHQQNRQVAVYSPLGTEKLSGDAKLAFQRLPGDIKQVENPDYDSADLIIDALFGAGLSKDITGKLAKVIEQINDAPADVLAVDLPSGINGETGAVCGIAIEATVSATFFRYKPGHFLFPGRQHCGCLEVGQIGIEDSVLPMIGVQTFRNGTSLWRNCFPSQSAAQHKYSRGHTLAVSGDLMMSGAARLMASAALRIGSELRA